MTVLRGGLKSFKGRSKPGTLETRKLLADKLRNIKKLLGTRAAIKFNKRGWW